MVIFDPQYKEIKPNEKRRVKGSLNNVNHSKEQIKTFFFKIAEVLKPSGFLVYWMDDLILIKGEYATWLPNNLKVKELLIWSKGNFVGLGLNYFRKNVEFALLIQKEPIKWLGGDKHRGIKNVFNEIVKFGGRHNIHEKPYQMTQTIIQQLTNEGDLVVDPCAGSFVSLRACQKLGRDFIGTDLTLRKLMKFNINKERSRQLLKQESIKQYEKK